MLSNVVGLMRERKKDLFFLLIFLITDLMSQHIFVDKQCNALKHKENFALVGCD